MNKQFKYCEENNRTTFMTYARQYRRMNNHIGYFFLKINY